MAVDLGKQQNTDEDSLAGMVFLLVQPLTEALRPKHACNTFPSTIAAYAREALSSSRGGAKSLPFGFVSFWDCCFVDEEASSGICTS